MFRAQMFLTNTLNDECQIVFNFYSFIGLALMPTGINLEDGALAAALTYAYFSPLIRNRKESVIVK